MIGLLPKTLTINNKELPIDSNFKTALLCMEVFNDTELSNSEQWLLVLDFIIGLDKLEDEDYKEAIEKVSWFLDGGLTYDNVPSKKKIMDWQQDEQMIFSAVNKVAGKETRAEPYIHWWTWLGYFQEINEGLFSTVVSIRSKKGTKKLTKEEEEFYQKNKNLVDIKPKYSDEEKEEIAKLNNLLR